ncbi:MAG: ABC-F family ATP-binding cassette domain-containing protein [Bacteroidales bacterium]|nr:ABC-F family ATP-binding cassette domain-containing protein [Bacteroidales bacterium]
MMNYLSVENLSYHWGDVCLFDDISFGINEGQKTALVARNGTGKTTLLNMLTAKLPNSSSDGKLYPDEGRIIFNEDVRVGYLPQNPYFNNENTVIQQVFECGTEVTDAIRDYALALESSDVDLIAKATDRMDSLKAWDYEQRIKQILSQLHINDFNQQVKNLSGGQQKRVALAALLISSPSFLILDEPTNHLDLDIIDWLEDYLTRSNITLLMVTHDRYFLDRVCSDILELDEHKIWHYEGNYSYYLNKKQERQNMRSAEADKARNLLRREQDWMNRQPQARGTKAQYRIDAFYELQEKAKDPSAQQSLQLQFAAQRMGKKVIDVYNIAKSFGDKHLINDFSYKFVPKEKVAIVGDNGCGKTTLLNMLTGALQPDNGHIEVGETIVFGYYRQEGITVNEGKTVLEVITDIADHIRVGGDKTMSAAQFLRYFMFSNELHHVEVNKLSGGEKKRLYLLTVLVKNPNFLILDEPTNDLDILTLNVLEDYLAEFQGTVIVVSHDRFFVDKIAQHLFVLDGKGGVKDFPGDYSDYIVWRKNNERSLVTEAKTKSEPVEKKPAKSNEKRRLTYNEKKEFAAIEEEMSRLTERKSEIESLMSGGTNDANELVSLSDEYQKVSQRLDEIEMRWLELSEYEA